MGLLLILAIGLATLWLALVAYTAWMLTHPPRRTYASAVARSRPGDPSELPEPRAFRSWSFRSSTGSLLPAWDVEGDDPGGPVIVLTHGWADSRIGGLARVAALAPLASRLILWELRAHGEAPGVCTLGPRERDDLRSLIEHLQPQGERDGPPLVLYGWSLGAGISIELGAKAPELPIDAIIAEAPYRERATPARNVLDARGLPHRAILAPALFLAAPTLNLAGAYRDFDRAGHATKLRCPLLVLHGSIDAVSPIEDGRTIAGAAPQGTLAEIAGAGHNDLWTDPRFAPPSATAVQQFIREITAGTSIHAPTTPDTLCSDR